MTHLKRYAMDTEFVSEWDDPVPANCDWNWEFPNEAPHEIEGRVRSALISHPDVEFASLVVRRTENCVFLQGVMCAGSNIPDLAHVVRQVAHVENVLNQVLIQESLVPAS